MSVIFEYAELMDFLEAAEAQFGDPADAVCEVFVRYAEVTYKRAELIAHWNGAARELWLNFVQPEGTNTLPLRTTLEAPSRDDDGHFRYQLRKVSESVWALAPSLNISGVMHGFLVFYDVPSPAPWEGLIVIAQTW